VLNLFLILIENLPQHNKLQLSGPVDVLLHCLPVVPNIPFLWSSMQKLGDLWMWTKSSFLTGTFRLTFPLRRSRFLAFGDIWTEFSYFCLSICPTCVNDGNVRQQVFNSHEPLTPWHRHFNSIWFEIALKLNSKLHLKLKFFFFFFFLINRFSDTVILFLSYFYFIKVFNFRKFDRTLKIEF
jgi:hypothetical protein